MKSKIYLSIMANKGKRPECFLRFFAILLIYMQVVNSQGLPEISDMIAELSYTDGEMNHLRGKRSVNTDILEYIVIIEVNVSQAILFEQIKSSLESISSFQIDNTTEIESVNITTVCHPNGSEYQCICEDQYFWSFNNCIVHHACNDLYEGVCTCIDVFPSDGQMCVTTSELPFFDILVEIELNTTSTTMLDELRNRFAEISFPITFGHAAEITDVAITTVCSLDGTEYQCRCEDQYLWPCEKCTVYGSCGNVTNSSCGCINAIPNDGHFCQPINELMNNSTCPTEPPPAEYLIEIEISAVDVTVLDQLRNILKTLSLPSINNNINITEINITTVCSLNGTEYQCRCEDQYFWPCEKCTLYGSCGYVTNSSCGCINALPYDGHFCQPISELMNNSTCPMETRTAEYLIEIEISAVDVTVLNQLRNILKTLSLPTINSNINITEINITTVCSLNGTEYQCRCEDQYFWPCEKCKLYGSCGYVTNSSCGCINALPYDGHFCQPISELTNNSTCPMETRTAEYLIEIEISAVDVTVLNQLRNILKTLSLPTINSNINITEINITTVCSLNGTEYQCRCEDQYFWPCEKCTLYGSCGYVTNSSCGCINTLPYDGHFCQPISELMNNSTCPMETRTAEYLIEIEISAVDVTVLNQLRNILKTLSLHTINSNINITEINITTVCSLNGTEYQCRCEDQYFWPCEKCTLYGSCGYVTNSSCGCINALPYDGHFCQPISELTNNSTCPMETRTAEYLIEIEISAVDVTVLNQLRNILKTLSLPTINSNINITEINITTVCSLNGTEYQCRCEDQYFWPCEKCKLYGSCGYVTNSSCGCINALPYDGHFCQPISELTNNSTCPMETRTAEYLIEIEISAVDVTVLNQLRNILKTLSLPTINSNINITEINITTVCSLNGTEYQCRCEDQYFWPCEKCKLYGSCNYVTSSSCDCINALPYDGHFCQPINELTNNSICPPDLPPGEYLIEIEIEIDAIDVTILNQLRDILQTHSLPTINSDISVTDVNITTVCSLNGTEYQCRCEDQYFWPCEKCKLYGSCGNITNSSCGCINIIPYDGHFCQPITELMNNSICPPDLPPGEYLIEIEIEIDAIDVTILNQLRDILQTHSLPTINSDISVTDVNITTVCSLNGTQYQCRCEDQYFWPCEKCTVYGSCVYITNSSCGCINTLPYDGRFCQPISELTNNSICQAVTTAPPLSTTTQSTTTNSTTATPSTQTTTTSTTATPSIQTTTNKTFATPSIQTTTTSTTATPSTQTTTTSTTATPSTQTTTTSTTATPSTQTTTTSTTATPSTQTTTTSTTATPSTQTTTTSTTATPSTQTTTTSTTATPSTQTTTTSTTATPSTQTTTAVLSFSMTINEQFDVVLTDQNSEKYNTYKQKIESSIDNSYKTLLGYQPKSATVTAFRPGSVITDFTIKTTNAALNLASANQVLASSLRLLGFDVSDTAFIQSVKDRLYVSNGNIYPGANLTLTCNPPVNNSIQWTLDGKLIKDNSNNILQLDNVSPDDSGQYECTTTVNEMPYVIWQIITILPYPNIEVSTSKVVQCEDTTIPLQCCVQEMYQVEWNISCTSTPTGSPAGCILCDYTIKQNDCQTTKHVTCKLKNPINGTTTQSHNSKSITISVSNKAFTCSDSIFGAGNLGDVRNGDCNKEMAGYQVARCNSSNLWQPIEDYCVPRIFATLKVEAENLQVGNLQQFMANVSNNAELQIQNITDSQATILTIVEILKIISNFSQTILINQPVMTNFLQTTDVIGSNDTRDTWVLLNKNSTTMNASSELLNSTESIARRLLNEGISIITNSSSLNKTSITAPFSGTFGKNLTTQINIPATSTQTSLTVIISSAFNNVLPVRNLTNNNSSQTGTSINGDVVLIETNSTINNISLSFDIKNKTLGNPQCVFWNFNLLNNIGGWDSTGCQLKKLGNETERITCECNHTTSFSILMSPFTLDKNFAIILDYITYIGVAISLGSLVLCLIIEMIIWKSVTRNDTSYMRHVSIVNIAVSLLIANICFIIGAAVVTKGEGPCSTATFFMHFFYLALFFWMLLSALLLLYRILMVFSRLTKGAMMAIAFTVGYGAPLIIAVITVASTAGSHGYIQKDYNCWLNWSKTKALLAFVIPALTIVAINLLVLIVVLCKMLRRGVNATTQPDEKHPLMVIARCVAILTPLFGLTWGFGIGTMVSPNFGIHVVFAFLNSLQGFFILLFGTLLDSKVREALARTFSLRNLSSIRTRSTSAGPSSSSGFTFFQRLRQRNVYNVSSAERSSSNSDTATDSYAARAML
ncbi:adhesion G protein-coupled receptor F5 isoform X5 [Ictalurus punctatus]|uniref:Adhesion G protein-coupled receptor F5 isoform X5 n=1 Tax=Ictalurus punctatus TaxID=7998 RepID=A0A9F7RRY5_ICTPU|nr:adhesion G protein-coupled receptor F5 isoform X5 [Ictalurus punctatus]